MRPRLLAIATIAGAIVLFLWQALSHEALHLPERGLRAFPNDSGGAPAHVIRALAPANGIYFSSRGVFAAVDISGDFADKTRQFGSMLGKQFVLNLAVVLLLSLLIDRFADASVLRTGALYGLLALTYQGMVDVSNAIWFNFPLAWTLGNMLDQLIAFFLVGLTIAALRNRFGEPRTETAERPAVASGERYTLSVGRRAHSVER